MTTKLTESTIETFAIEFLEKQGYQYIYGPDIAPDSEKDSGSISPPSGGRGASGASAEIPAGTE